MSEIRYWVCPGEKQYLDHRQASQIFSGSEDYVEELEELFAEFISDQWGHDELSQVRALGDVHQNYENVTEHFIKRRFGRVDFSGWDGGNN